MAEIQRTRTFNADVGQDSVGNAGPDAIEQDLDNLYENKAWKDEVLTKDNTESYIPTQDYHPATKKYADSLVNEGITNVITNNITTIQTDIINNQTSEALNSWTKDLVIETLNTNFEDYVTGVTVTGTPIGNNNTERNFLQSVKEGIRLIQQTLSLVATNFMINGKQVYYTSVRGNNSYKFLTIQNPLQIAGNWQARAYYKPYMIVKGADSNYYYVNSNYSENGYETFSAALGYLTITSEEEHKVKVKTITTENEKASIEFKDVSGVKEVLMTLGIGDGILPKSAKAEIYKGADGLEINYYKSNTGEKMNVKLDDTGIHSNNPVYSTSSVRNIIVTNLEPDISMGNVNDVIFKVGV